MSQHPTPSLFARLCAALRAEFASRLARDTLLVLGASAVGRALALGKEVLVAALFGVGGVLDAFVLALLIPSFLVNIMGATFSCALVPSIGGVLAKQGESAARQAVGRALALLCALLALAALVILLLPTWALQALAPLANAETLERIRSLQLALLPIPVLGCLASVLAALVNLRGDFKRPALAALGNNLAVLVLTAALYPRAGVYALALGIDAGLLLEVCVLMVLLRKSWGGVLPGWLGPADEVADTLSDRLAGHIAALRPLLRDWGMLALGAGLFGLTAFVDNAIASTLGEGAVSALSYAWKLPAGFATLLGLTLSTVLLPYFTAVTHNAPPAELLRSSRRIMQRLLIFCLPLALAGALASPLLVELLFQRGRFDAQASATVSVLQACYFLQLPCYLLWIAASRMLQALSRFRFLLVVQAVLLVVNVLTSLALSRWLGVLGITVSSTVMYMLAAGATLAAIWRHVRTAETRADAAARR